MTFLARFDCKESDMQLPVGNRGFRLLTPGNPKTEKGRGLGYWTFILHLSPARLYLGLTSYASCIMYCA